MTTQLSGQVDATQIEKWKDAHGDGIYFISNKTDIAYFREPLVHDVEAALAAADDEKPFAAIRRFGDITFIGGSDRILKDGKMFLGARRELAKHWGGIEAQSGNL